MTLTHRRVAAMAAPLLLALSLTACGGGASGAPDDASKSDFCDAFGANPLLDTDIDTADTDKAADALHDYADKLNDVGTTSDFDGDAREGFEIYVDTLREVDGDDLKSDDPGVSDGDADKVGTFTTKAVSVCGPGDLGDLGDIESELPSDFPS